MPDTRTIRNLNLELAAKINDDVRADPASPYAGKIVGLSSGQVVAVADTWDEIGERLDQIEPDAIRTYCFEAGVSYHAVQDV
jgi:hypothetical protein